MKRTQDALYDIKPKEKNQKRITLLFPATTYASDDDNGDNGDNDDDHISLRVEMNVVQSVNTFTIWIVDSEERELCCQDLSIHASLHCVPHILFMSPSNIATKDC
jgi:hypothetical protein